MHDTKPEALDSQTATPPFFPQKCFNLPHKFIGRSRELATITQRLNCGDLKQLAITGPAGQGKTALALQLALNMAAAGWKVAAWCANPQCGKAFSHFVFEDLALQLEPENARHITRQYLTQCCDVQQRDQVVLEQLVSQSQGKLLLILDNLESLQINNTRALSHRRLNHFIDSCRALQNRGLCLIITTRRPLPDWPEDQHWPLDKLSLSDFRQLAHQHSHLKPLIEDKPRLQHVHQLLNCRGWLFLKAAQHGKSIKQQQAFMQCLQSSSEELRCALIMNQALQALDREELQLLRALQVFEQPVALQGVMALFPDTPIPSKAHLKRLVELGLVHYRAHPSETYHGEPALAEHVNNQLKQAPSLTITQFAANYVVQAYHRQPGATVQQALLCHRALNQAQQQETAADFALANIVEALHNAGWHQVLRDHWLPQLRQANNQASRAKATINTALQHERLGNSEAALSDYQQGIALLRDLGDDCGVADTLNKVSLIYAELGHREAAINSLKRGLAIQQRLDDKHGQGTTLNNMSQIYKTCGDHAMALNSLEKSLTLFREAADKKGQGSALNNLAGIYRADGDYKKAINYLKQSLALRREINDLNGEGITLNNLSAIACDSGDHQSALHYIQQSLAITQQLEDKSGEATTLNNMSAIYYACGNEQAARQHLKQCLTLKRQIGDRQGVCLTLFDIGHLYLNYERDTAMAYWLECYELAKQNRLTTVLEALKRLSEQLECRGGLRYWETLMRRQTVTKSSCKPVKNKENIL